MIWFEVIEETDGGCEHVTRRFKTEEAACEYANKNAESCYSGYERVNTEYESFWYNGADDDEFGT